MVCVSIALSAYDLAAQDTTARRTSIAPLAPMRHARIESIRFTGIEQTGLSESELFAQMALRSERRSSRAQRLLSWLPFAPDHVTEARLDPVELLRDRERLRRFLVNTGYPAAAVSYAVEPTHTRDSAVVVRFRIAPGRPELLDTMEVRWRDTSRSTRELPTIDALRRTSNTTPILETGARFDRRRVEPTRAALWQWFANQGFAEAVITDSIVVGDDSTRTHLQLIVDPGRRVSLGDVRIEGNRAITASAARRHLAFVTGMSYTPSRIERGRQQLLSLPLIRQVSITSQPRAASDSVIDLRVQIIEEPRHSVAGQAGYTSEGGVVANASWTENSLWRSGRTLTANVTGQSGVLALIAQPRKFVRASVDYGQSNLRGSPWQLDLGPFAELRNDYRDHSSQYGLEASLARKIGGLSSVSLRYHLSTRRILRYAFGDVSGGIDILELLQRGSEGILDTLGARLDASTLTASANLGRLDVPLRPTRGFAVEPALTVAIPGTPNSTEYALGSLRATAYLPISARTGLAMRLGGARLLPFGKSIPATVDDGFSHYLRLRDVLLTAGGVDDVRGYAERQLGPRFPRVIAAEGPDSTSLSVRGFVPIAGFNKMYSTLELRMPAPWLSRDWSSHVFLDGGRIWTNDARFTDPADPNGYERYFWTTGAGIQYETILGSVRLAMGYKLNPSVLDLASAEDIWNATRTGQSWESVSRNPYRRFRLHVGIGARL
jgi:outer membrane protein insertion porin family